MSTQGLHHMLCLRLRFSKVFGMCGEERACLWKPDFKLNQKIGSVIYLLQTAASLRNIAGIRCLPAVAFACLVSGLSVFPGLLHGQVAAPVSTSVEQQLENITENNEDVQPEDDSFIQSMRQFLKNPINLNAANGETLKELFSLSPIQVQNFLSYRNLLGNFIDIYELQAVPGFDLSLIERIRPYITVGIPEKLITSVRERMSGGTRTMIARVSQLVEKQKGFLVDTATNQKKYPGSRQRLFVRYKYQFKNLLQYGLLGEKDAGERFFKGAQKQGFDFYSAHLFVRNAGAIQSLALGDFTVNLGQGLTQWQSLAFRKSADVTNIKRQLAVLRPYNSAGEVNFHRGIGITLAKKNVEATAFISFKQVDGNLITDTANNEGAVSSFQTSGMHRTASEAADKGAQRQFTVGGNLSYRSNRFHIGLNGVHYQFKLPVQKADEPYNLYALSGKQFGNYSMDYSYGYRNLHFFGEAALTDKLDKAFISGLILAADSKVDLSFLYRNISKKYQALYSNAFTENSMPTNERGLYAGLSVRPHAAWRIDAFADYYKFPWLRYLVDAPSAGSEYLLQVSYKPNKQLDISLRYRTESKAKNFNPGAQVTGPVLPRPKEGIRWQCGYKVSKELTLRNRVELLWFDKKGLGAQHGILANMDAIVKPMMKRYSGSTRLQYFATDGYDSRLYAYENDVLYSFSIPVFYGRGFRYYINVNYDMGKNCSIWLRWAQTIYTGQSSIGSGSDEIAGNKRTEVKVQASYEF